MSNEKGLADMAGATPEEIEQVDIVAFSPEDVHAISTLPLTLIKAVVSEAQFAALTKFVNINQTITGLNDGVRHDA